MDQELAALQQSIQDLHQLMSIMTDPAATDVVAQCVKALTGLQKTMMTPQPGAQQQALAQRFSGGQQSGYSGQ